MKFYISASFALLIFSTGFAQSPQEIADLEMAKLSPVELDGARILPPDLSDLPEYCIGGASAFADTDADGVADTVRAFGVGTVTKEAYEKVGRREIGLQKQAAVQRAQGAIAAYLSEELLAERNASQNRASSDGDVESIRLDESISNSIVGKAKVRISFGRESESYVVEYEDGDRCVFVAYDVPLTGIQPIQ